MLKWSKNRGTVSNDMLCDYGRVCLGCRALPPTTCLLGKSISKWLFDQLVKYLAVNNNLTSLNIPALGTKPAFPCQGSAGVLIYHTAEKLDSAFLKPIVVQN